MSEQTLDQFKIAELPGTAYYIPNFISDAEEKYLLEKVYSAPKPKWKHLSNRRLQNWGGLPHPKGMIQEPLPEWLSMYCKKISELDVFREKLPNHVLVNEYLAGQGIMPHEDGPLFYPTITTINIGSHTVLNYYNKVNDSSDGCDNKASAMEATDGSSRHIGSLLLERCSLLIVQDDLYHKYLHGIEERRSDTVTNDIANLARCTVQNGAELERDTRISLTIRHVPHTLKARILFGANRLI